MLYTKPAKNLSRAVVDVNRNPELVLSERITQEITNRCVEPKRVSHIVELSLSHFKCVKSRSVHCRSSKIEVLTKRDTKKLSIPANWARLSLRVLANIVNNFTSQIYFYSLTCQDKPENLAPESSVVAISCLGVLLRFHRPHFQNELSNLILQRDFVLD